MTKQIQKQKYVTNIGYVFLRVVCCAITFVSWDLLLWNCCCFPSSPVRILFWWGCCFLCVNHLLLLLPCYLVMLSISVFRLFSLVDEHCRILSNKAHCHKEVAVTKKHMVRHGPFTVSMLGFRLYNLGLIIFILAFTSAVVSGFCCRGRTGPNEALMAAEEKWQIDAKCFFSLSQTVNFPR